MGLRDIIATVLQAVGVLTVAAGVGFVSFWGGLVTFGVGLVLFGVAVERGDEPTGPGMPPLPPS